MVTIAWKSTWDSQTDVRVPSDIARSWFRSVMCWIQTGIPKWDVGTVSSGLINCATTQGDSPGRKSWIKLLTSVWLSPTLAISAVWGREWMLKNRWIEDLCLSIALCNSTFQTNDKSFKIEFSSFLCQNKLFVKDVINLITGYRF